MAKIAIAGNPSGTATYTIASPAGSTDRTLTLPDASGTVGLAGAAVTRSQLPAGSVLQVVSNGPPMAMVTISSLSYVDTGAFVTITPSSASSRIMLLFRSGKQSWSIGTSQAQYRFYRNTTGIGFDPQTDNNLDGDRYGYSFAMFFVDSPNTTSAVTYRVYGRTPAGGNFTFNIGADTYEFIAMEIAA